jgi:hypothetical protein
MPLLVGVAEGAASYARWSTIEFVDFKMLVRISGKTPLFARLPQFDLRALLFSPHLRQRGSMRNTMSQYEIDQAVDSVTGEKVFIGSTFALE